MDEELFKKGLEKRKATLGAEYVEKNLAKADDFTTYSKPNVAFLFSKPFLNNSSSIKTPNFINILI
jgi:4-carboxymuconolactone decarboxylase